MSLDKWLAYFRGEEPERVLTPAEQIARYEEARAAFEGGTGDLEAMTAAVTPVVAEHIAAQEEAGQKRVPLDPPVNVVALAVVLGTLVMWGFWMLLFALGTVHQSTHQRYPTTLNCANGTCISAWQLPALQWKLTGPGTLVTEVGGIQESIRVLGMIEKTNGPETQLPVYYIAPDGEEHTVSGWFWFKPDDARGMRSVRS